MNEDIKIVYSRLGRAGLSFLLVLLIGMTGYHFIVDGTTWFDGLYMTFLTVTTIGFSEVVNLEGHPMGRVFTIFIAFCGIGILSYAFSNLAALIIENDITKQMNVKEWKKKLNDLRNIILFAAQEP